MTLWKKASLLAGLIGCGVTTLLLFNHASALKKNKNGCYILTKAQDIKKSGCYILEKDIIVSSNKKVAIKITANNVVLDLNSKKIYRKISDKGNFGLLLANISNVEIKNGSLDNFYNAIVLIHAKHLNVNHVFLDRVNNIGIRLSQIKDSKILNNKIVLNTSYKKNDPVNFYLVGITLSYSKKIDISKNNISSPYSFDPEENPRLEQVGLLLSANNSNIKITQNVVHYVSLWPKTYGIWISTTNNSSIQLSDGKISNAMHGLVPFSPKHSSITNYAFAITDSSACTSKKLHFHPIAILLNKSHNIKTSHNQMHGYKYKTLFHQIEITSTK